MKCGDRLREAHHPFGVTNLTLPDNEDRPSSFPQRLNMPRIPFTISGNLLRPVRNIRLHPSPAVHAFWASMPEAPVDKNAGSAAREYQVGFAGQTLGMKAETQTSPMERTSDYQLGRSIPTSNTAHVLAASGRGELVHNAG